VKNVSKESATQVLKSCSVSFNLHKKPRSKMRGAIPPLAQYP